MTKKLLDMVEDPSMSSKNEHLNSLHKIYRQPARLGHFSARDRMLYTKEIFEGDTKFPVTDLIPVQAIRVQAVGVQDYQPATPLV